VFFIAYFLLADKYSKTAYEIPFLIRNKKVPQAVPCCIKKVTFWLMMFLCIMFPAIDGISYGRVAECCLDKEKALQCCIGRDPAQMLWSCLMVVDCILIITISSMLMCAIAKIHNELKDKDTEVDTLNIILHATTFGLFAVSYVIQRVLIIAFYRRSNTDHKVYGVITFVLDTFNFVSQLILCFILWGLGSKREDTLSSLDAVSEIDDERRLSLHSIPEIQIFNTEDEVQARIWL